MSNNSGVCADGSEIGRAQYLQAQAAGVEPSNLHNPVLLKPGSDRRAFVVLRGKPYGELRAGEYATGRKHLAEAAFEAYAELAATHDLVVCEGAGSPAEVNLRKGDYVNMGLARQFNLPVAVVGDIDRGGILASFVGTHALLDEADRALLKAFIVNKFRGDQTVLEPGLKVVTKRTGVPVLGVLPWITDTWIDSEDALSIGRWRLFAPAADQLRVAVVPFPRASNATDLDALAVEPGVSVELTADPGACFSADLMVLPGTRATVSDLGWLRERGLDRVVAERVAAGRPVLGICGGYQMLVGTLDDEIESGSGVHQGLGVLPGHVRFGSEKVLGRPIGDWEGNVVTGYEIHHGVVDDDGSFPGGSQRGVVWGTIWHGTMENDEFRRYWLSQIAEQAGSNWRPSGTPVSFAAQRESMINRVADTLEAHLDLAALLDLAKVS